MNSHRKPQLEEAIGITGLFPKIKLFDKKRTNLYFSLQAEDYTLIHIGGGVCCFNLGQIARPHRS